MTGETRHSAAEYSPSGLVLLVGAIGIGWLLRGFGISDQIVAGDEFHGLLALVNHSGVYIFSHFFENDICIPLTLISKAIAHTIGLDELTFRLPSLATGFAGLCIFPALIRHWLVPYGTVAFTALLAISPQMVFYSRLSRPYAISTLLVFVAVVSFLRWIETKDRRLAWVYVLCAAGASYFHLLALPAVVTPLLVGLIWSPRGAPERLRRWIASLILQGAAIAICLGGMLAAPLLVSGHVMTSKVAMGRVDASVLVYAGQMFAGTASPWLGAAFGIAFLVGIVVGLHRHRRASTLLLAVIAVQVFAVAIASPHHVERPGIFSRYVVWLLPFVLFFVATALAELSRLPIGRRRWPIPFISTVALATLLYVNGPLPATYYTPNNFTNHSHFRDYSLRSFVEPAEVPIFYDWLKEERNDLEVVEAPWYYGAGRFYVYQQVHGRSVRIGFARRLLGKRFRASEIPLDDSRFRFRRFVDLSNLAEMRKAGVGYVVLHKSLSGEATFPVPILDVRDVVAYYRARLGKPVWEDRQLVAFSLESVIAN